MTSKSLTRAVQKPEVIRQSKIDAYVAKIENSWQKTLETIFAVGDLIENASKELSRDEYALLLNSLSFGPRAAEQLRRIANDKRLRKVSLQKSLPACWTTLCELNRYSDKELERAKKEKWIKPCRTRAEIIAYRNNLRNGNQKSKAKAATTLVRDRAGVITSPTLIFEVPDDLSNYKALLDIHFICNLAHEVFSSISGKSKVRVNRAGTQPSKKLLSSHNVLHKLIKKAREVENHKRAKQGQAPLNDIQAILSLFGADPDALGETNFSLMERIALAYARRQGINCIEDWQLNWFAAKNGIEPVLQGSFLDDVDKQVAAIIAGKRGKPTTPGLHQREI